MAWYYGTYNCGHEGRTNVIGPTKNRQWIADRHFEKLCPECWEKQRQADREKANQEAVEKAKEMELPELTGSEKQVAWANTLRQQLIEGIDNFKKDEIKYLERQTNMTITDEKKIELINYVVAQTSAKWFIDNRGSAMIVTENILNDLKNKPSQEEQTIIEEIIQESTVFPENAITTVPVEIEVTNTKVTAIFEKNDQFRKLVKDLGYTWGNGWYREITKFNGPAADRAAELGNKLLNAGFPILITDSIIREKAINGNYNPEQKRWITVRSQGEYSGWIAIWWEDDDQKIYNIARKLPSSKWSKPSVVVRVNHYQEVEEFADLYGFKLADSAQKAIEDFKENLKKVSVVNPAKVNEESAPDGLKEILNSSDEVLDDLREDD